MIFSREQVALIRAGKMTATLITLDHSVRPGNIRPLIRRFEAVDPEGKATGEWITQRIVSRTDDTDEPVVLTIEQVQRVAVNVLDHVAAIQCGFKSASALHSAWFRSHPNADEALFVRFAVGDRRDRERYLNWTGRAGGDYVHSAARGSDRGVGVVSVEDQRELSRQGRERHAERESEPLRRHRDDMQRSARVIEEEIASLTRRAENVKDRTGNSEIRNRLRRLERLSDHLAREIGHLSRDLAF